MNPMQQYECYYHENVQAVEKCEKCGRYLCINCKYLHVERDSDSNPTSSHVLCPVCEKLIKINQDNSIQWCIGIIAPIIILIIIIASNLPRTRNIGYYQIQEPGNPEYIIIATFFFFIFEGGMIYYILKEYPKKKVQFEEELKNIQIKFNLDNQNNKKIPPKKQFNDDLITISKESTKEMSINNEIIPNQNIVINNGKDTKNSKINVEIPFPGEKLCNYCKQKWNISFEFCPRCGKPLN